jgi:hypothetical protein
MRSRGVGFPKAPFRLRQRHPGHRHRELVAPVPHHEIVSGTRLADHVDEQATG